MRSDVLSAVATEINAFNSELHRAAQVREVRPRRPGAVRVPIVAARLALFLRCVELNVLQLLALEHPDETTPGWMAAAVQLRECELLLNEALTRRRLPRSQRRVLESWDTRLRCLLVAMLRPGAGLPQH